MSTLDYDLRVKISEVCSNLDVDGLRGDIVVNSAAKAHAAYDGRTEVTVEILVKLLFYVYATVYEKIH